MVKIFLLPETDFPTDRSSYIQIPPPPLPKIQKDDFLSVVGQVSLYSPKTGIKWTKPWILFSSTQTHFQRDYVSMCNKNIIRNCKKKSKNVYFVLLQKHSLLTSNIFSTSPLLSLEIWNSISTLFNAFVNQKIYFKESSKKSTILIWRALIPSDRIH